jgi:ATP-dependent Clp protease ATP-binding subunit ClpB
MTLQVTDAALTLLAREGYDPLYGARPLRRAIQRELENPLARRILGGEVTAGDTIIVDVGPEGGLTFNGSAEPAAAPRVMSTPGGSTAIN